MDAPVEKVTGRRKESFDNESTAELLAKTKSLIRTNWDGHDAIGVIHRKALAESPELGPKTLDFIKRLVEEQVSGSRSRTAPRLDEAIKRAKARPPVETAP